MSDWLTFTFVNSGFCFANTRCSKSLCANDDYGTKTQKYIKQFQLLTVLTYLGLGITDGTSVGLVSLWRVNNSLETGGGHFEQYL
jgi:hypothetical protein